MGKNLTASTKRRIYRKFGGKCVSCGVHCYETYDDWHGRFYDRVPAYTGDGYYVNLKPGVTKDNANEEQRKVAHVDHIVPKCKGGTNEESNLQLLCSFCNCSKNGRTMDEFNRLKQYKASIPEIAKALEFETGRCAELWVSDAGKIGTSIERQMLWLLDMLGYIRRQPMSLDDWLAEEVSSVAA